MAVTKLVRLTNRVRRDLEDLFGAKPTRLADAHTALLHMLLTAASNEGVLASAGDGPVRGLCGHVQELSAYLLNQSCLPEALCAHYRYRQSKNRVLHDYRISESDWCYVDRLARDCGWDLDLLVSTIPYETLAWHDELEKRIVSVEVVLDPRALDDMLICALETYLSPRKREAYEVYGITLGMFRDAAERRKGSGTMTTRFVSVARAQPQLSAVCGSRHCEPNYRSLDTVVKAAATLFPQHQLLGDFHSHVFGDLAELQVNHGWQPSSWDAGFSDAWAQKVRGYGHTPQVDFIIAVARCTRHVSRSHYRGMPHTNQATVGECRVIVAAYRILQSGRYTSERLHLFTPGMTG